MPALAALALLLTAQTGVDAWEPNMGQRYCSLRMRRRDGAEVLLSRSTIDPGTIVRVRPPPARDRDGVDPFGTYLDLRIAGYRAWVETVSDGTGGAAAALDPQGFAAMLAAGAVRVTGNGPSVEIPLPPDTSVERMMAACLEKLRIAERGSGEPQAVPPRPITSLATLLRNGEPGDEHGRTGWISLRLTVAAQGHVIGCEVTASARDAKRDLWACRALIPRARFTPAADAAGRPTAGTYDLTLTREE